MLLSAWHGMGLFLRDVLDLIPCLSLSFPASLISVTTAHETVVVALANLAGGF